jgi:outer membrane protein OmpA-like peptidoglycan-associated protein
MRTIDKNLIAASVLAGLIGACATTPPAQLLEARTAYTSSSQGLSAKLTPTELYEARTVLDKANKEFAEHGDTLECRYLAYIATNKVQLADVKARTAVDRERIVEAAGAGVVVRDSQMKEARAALSSTREQLKEERRDNYATTKELRATNNAQSQEIAKSAEQLETEKQARLSAENKLAGAMRDLAAIAAVKEETRGIVITLSGSILFASNRYALLNTAMTKLDQVAEALKAQDLDKRMVVEGHTDSQGSDRVNQPLSFNRATAVRDYLVSRGVASEKISAIGMGSSRPLLDNRNSENRANNRRVEIIIQPSHLSLR